MPKVPKLRKVELAQLGDLLNALDLSASSIQGAITLARLVRTEADEAIDAYRTKLQRHLDNKDIRPHFLAKPLPKNQWHISFNSVVYVLGPYTNFGDIDEDEPQFYWSTMDGVVHPCRSMFMALIAINQHYCNVALDTTVTAPVSVTS